MNTYQSNNYICRQCNNRNVRVTQMQSREPDEPCRIFIVCLACYMTYCRDGSITPNRTQTINCTNHIS